MHSVWYKAPDHRRRAYSQSPTRDHHCKQLQRALEGSQADVVRSVRVGQEVLLLLNDAKTDLAAKEAELKAKKAEAAQYQHQVSDMGGKVRTLRKRVRELEDTLLDRQGAEAQERRLSATARARSSSQVRSRSVDPDLEVDRSWCECDAVGEPKDEAWIVKAQEMEGRIAHLEQQLQEVMECACLRASL